MPLVCCPVNQTRRFLNAFACQRDIGAYFLPTAVTEADKMSQPDPWMDETPWPGPDDDSEPSPEETEESQPVKAGRSSIRFPYTDLKQAARIPAVIKNEYGSGCDIDQLAGALQQSPRSGSFRTRVAAAVGFGLVTSRKNRVTITPLGHEVAGGSRSALAKAFLSVELYKALYERYRGITLPADPGLTAEIRDLGVLASQADRARQVMQRSAEFAGFFHAGTDRLIMPPVGTVERKEQPATHHHPAPPAHTPDGSGGSQSMANNPLLQGLWSMLPTGTEFPAEKREQWFKALAVNLDLVYGTGDEVVVVEVKRHRRGSQETH